jgi:acetoacetyl-CoA synthetase
MDDAAVYNGKITDLRDKMAAVVAGLAECADFNGAVAIPRFPIPRDVSRIPKTRSLETFLSHVADEADPEFVRIPFHAPFMICYSSGTTGQPKAIVHSAGGVMLNYFKEGVLHEGIGPDTVSLQFTTVGWIMYVANTFGLLWGARCVFYDGSPFVPDAMTLIRIMGEQRVTKLGTSPRWMLELKNRGIVPRKIADLSALRTVTSTGMVLSDELSEWFYDVAFPKEVHLANISGGTDIVSENWTMQRYNIAQCNC